MFVASGAGTEDDEEGDEVAEEGKDLCICDASYTLKGPRPGREEAHQQGQLTRASPLQPRLRLGVARTALGVFGACT